MTVSPPSVFPCVMIYWFIDVAIQCKLLYWLSTNKGRKTHVSELRTRSSHASLWSQVQICQQQLHAPVAVFSLEQKVTKSQMKRVSSVWMRCLASRSLSGLISQCSVYIDINSRGARTVHPLSLAKMKNIIVINVCFPLEKILSTCIVITKCVWFLALKLLRLYCLIASPTVLFIVLSIIHKGFIIISSLGEFYSHRKRMFSPTVQFVSEFLMGF